MNTLCRSKLDYYTANYIDSIPNTFATRLDPLDPPPPASDNDSDKEYGIGKSNNPLHVQVAQIEDDLR